MKEKEPQFTVIDRRKFTSEGDVRPNMGNTEEEREAAKEAATAAATATAGQASIPTSGIHAVPAASPTTTAVAENEMSDSSETTPPDGQPVFEGPTAEESAQSQAAYNETTRQMDEILRTKIPGGIKESNIGFEHVVQSLYMTAVMHLGAGTPQGEKARVDLMGARQTIDMLEILEKKTRGNLNENEKRMMDSALFEARMMFLEITNAIARNATQGPPPQQPMHPLDPRSKR